MYCPKCGYKCKEEDLFCPNCGTSLHPAKNVDKIDDTYAQKIDIESINNNYLYNNRKSKNIKYESYSNIGIYALLCSLLGLFIPYIGLVLEIIAIVLGNKAKGTTSEKSGSVGKIIAIIGLTLWGVAMLIYVYLIGMQ